MKINTMKKLAALVMAALMLLALAGCGGSQAPAEVPVYKALTHATFPPFDTIDEKTGELTPKKAGTVWVVAKQAGVNEDEEEVVPFKEEEVKMMNEVDRLPEFPGGMAQLMKWLTKNLTYPEMAKARQISGRVVVSFIINSDGTVDDAKLLNTVDPMLDREALRVVKMMPKWNPGLSGGKACRTLVHMPVVFKL